MRKRALIVAIAFLALVVIAWTIGFLGLPTPTEVAPMTFPGYVVLN
jgi:hypothetical protein